MKSVLLCCQLVGSLAVATFYAPTAAAQEQKAQAVQYTVTDLGVLTSANPGPLALKNDGLFAESVTVSNGIHAAISFLGMMQIDLAQSGGLGGTNSATFGVNDWGQAAGEAETPNLDVNLEDFCAFGTRKVCQPFIWQDGVMSPLPPLKNQTGVAGRNAAAKGINNWGQVAGVAENATPDLTCPAYDPASSQYQKDQFKPVIWADGDIQGLPTSGIDANGKAFNDPDGVVFSINDSGEAVGATGTCTGFTAFSYLNGLHATLWQDGSVIDLGSLGGMAAPSPATGLGNIGNFAYDVNRYGHVVGTSGTSDGSYHAFFWSPETLIQDAGTVQGDVASVGLAISDVGDIGGVSFPANPNALPRAFIRPDGGTMVDLNTLVTGNTDLYLFTVCSINSREEIIGLAFDTQGNAHGYLATPSNGAEDPLDETAAAMRSARFEHAWQVVRERMGRGVTQLLNPR